MESAVGDDEREGIIHETSIASAVDGVVAVDQLLLGEGGQIARYNLVDALHCSNGGECPATPCVFIHTHNYFQ